MRQFSLLITLLLVFLLVACSDNNPNQTDPNAVDKKPFFKADANKQGPLTLEELQISLPKYYASILSEKQRNCFFESVQKRAIEAGDPALLNPDDLPYWDGTMSLEDWKRFDNLIQRTLLAQAIISWAMIEC